MADYTSPNYNATESERVHRLNMTLGSTALLNRLIDQHPAIIARLQRRAEQRSK